MEVHHHPDLHHNRKRFREYFLEFLMIFLAVTMGFMAESLRENISNKEKERDYISSFINNLKDDTANFKSTIADNREKLRSMRKLMALSGPGISDPVNRRLFFTCMTDPHGIGHYADFQSNDATMLQLKNSGGLRLIQKDHVADSIAKYDEALKDIRTAEMFYFECYSQVNLAEQEIMDYSIFNDTTYFKDDEPTYKFIPLLSDDPKKIKGFFNKVYAEMGSTRNYINRLETYLPYTIRLIEFLKKEYGVK